MERIVTGTAHHGVGTAATVKYIVSGSALQAIGRAGARQRVVERVSGGVDRSAHQSESLHVLRQGIRHIGRHAVYAPSGALDDGVPDVVDDEEVVSGAAVHAVGTALAIEPVIA